MTPLDLGNGMAEAVRPDVWPTGTVKSLHNAIPDRDGSILVLPWRRTHNKTDVSSGMAVSRFQRSDVPVFIYDGTNTYRHWPPYSYALTSPDSRNAAFVGYEGQEIRSVGLAVDATIALQAFTGIGLSNLVPFTNVAAGVNSVDLYYAVHGTIAPTNTGRFYIFRDRYVDSATPPTTGIVSSGMLASDAIGYQTGSKFPFRMVMYRGHLVCAGDASAEALMAPLVYWSARDNFALYGTSLVAGFGAQNYVQNMDFYMRGGCAVQNLAVLDDTLFVFTSRGIVRQRGGPANGIATDVSEIGNGCVASGSVMAYRDSLIYLGEQGFTLLGAGGQSQNFSANLSRHFKAMIAAQRTYGPYGMFDQLGGSANIVDDKYWYAPPNDQALYCFDFKGGKWSIHDQRSQFSTSQENELRLVTIAGSRGPTPILHYLRNRTGGDAGKTLHTKRMSATERVNPSDGLAMYKSDATDAADDWIQPLPFRVELAPLVSPDRVTMKPTQLSLDVEMAWVNDNAITSSFASGLFGVEVVDDRGRAIVRGIVAGLKDGTRRRGIGDRMRVYIPMPQNAPYATALYVKLFSTEGTLNLAGVGSVASTFLIPSYLRILAARWMFTGDAESDDADFLLAFSPLGDPGLTDNAGYRERYQTIDGNGVTLYQQYLLLPPWVKRTTAVPAVWELSAGGDYVRPSASTAVAGPKSEIAASFYGSSVVGDMHVWELAYRIMSTNGNTTDAGLDPLVSYQLRMALCNEGMDVDLSLSGYIPVLSPECPLLVTIYPAAVAQNANPTLQVRWYKGRRGTDSPDVGQVEITLSTDVVNQFYTRPMRVRVTRVPGTNRFWIDHSVVATPTTNDDTFAANRDNTNRIECQLYTDAAQSLLTPLVIGRSNGINKDHLRWRGLDGRPLTQPVTA